MQKSTVVVHGATGTQGAPVVRRLLAEGHRVRALSRTPSAQSLPQGAEPVPADLADAESLAAAYAGADAVVIHLPLVFTDLALIQAEAVLTALAKAGVRRAVFNSNGPTATEPVGAPMPDARALLAAELPRRVETASLVTPAFTYMENLAGPWSAPRVAAGEVAYPLPADIPVPWVAMDDVADAIAGVLADPSPPAVRVITGPQALTGDQVADELSAALNRPVRWITLAPDLYERMLLPHIGPEAAAGVASAYTPPPPGSPPPPAPDAAVVRAGGTTLRAWAARQDWSG